MNLRDQILQADDLPRVPLVVPEWHGITVHIRTMTGRDRDRFEALFANKGSVPADFRTRLAVMTVCDEQGVPAFSDADIPALSGKSSAALDRIMEAACKLNKLRPKDYDELGKGSASTPSGAGPSGSPSPSDDSTSTGCSPS